VLLAAGLLAAPLMLAACARPDHLSFTADRRIHITAPAANSAVSVPFTVRWSVRDFQRITPKLGTDTSRRPVSTHAGYFAVFVDSNPMGPGQSFDALLHDDPECASSPTCPDLNYLNQRLGVLVTSGTSVTIDSVSGTGVGGAGSNTHGVTVVMVDSRGRRIGDSSWYVSFTVKSA
jgi:hypothetical protein